jgi:hypothetical protein
MVVGKKERDSADSAERRLAQISKPAPLRHGTRELVKALGDFDGI